MKSKINQCRTKGAEKRSNNVRTTEHNARKHMDLKKMFRNGRG